MKSILLVLVTLFISAAHPYGLIAKSYLDKSQTKTYLKGLGLSSSFEYLDETLGVILIDLPDTSTQNDLYYYYNSVKGSQYFSYVVFDFELKRRPTYFGTRGYGDLWNIKDGKFSSETIKAWEEFGVNATDANGSKVAAVVIDGGVEVTHPQLSSHVWVNPGEIPANGIDDDNNGYIDDIYGWNPGKDSGDVSFASHATHVAGIIGAHNTDTMRGINPHTTILSVDVFSYGGDSTLASTVVKALSYIATVKRAWFFSNGQLGANIVATNSSFGVDYGNCTDDQYALWNDLYNSLGQLGIISSVAAPNTQYDVDRLGDVPSGCSSPYMIGVGNIDEAGENQGAWGKLSVDLFAQGTEILSTVTGGRFDTYTGTSMATPHVTGAISYLYSIAPRNFIDFYMLNPSLAALQMRELLIGSTKKFSKFMHLNRSSGVLNVYNASRALYGLEFQEYDF